jgi:hypothetical protein
VIVIARLRSNLIVVLKGSLPTDCHNPIEKIGSRNDDAFLNARLRSNDGVIVIARLRSNLIVVHKGPSPTDCHNPIEKIGSRNDGAFLNAKL